MSISSPAVRGVSFMPMERGFVIRASCRSFLDTILLVGRAGVITALPFVLWWDLIRNIWYEEGPGFWLTIGFLAVWAAAIAYVDFIALLSLAGEIRITKTGDSGKIFTGIGGFGWSHNISWKEFSSALTVTHQKSGRDSFRSRGIQLSGPVERYKFGWLLPDDRAAHVTSLLNKHVFSIIDNAEK